MTRDSENNVVRIAQAESTGWTFSLSLCVCVCVCAHTAAAGMLWECVQCPQLTELDLKGCHLVELCDELQV